MAWPRCCAGLPYVCAVAALWVVMLAGVLFWEFGAESVESIPGEWWQHRVCPLPPPPNPEPAPTGMCTSSPHATGMRTGSMQTKPFTHTHTHTLSLSLSQPRSSWSSGGGRRVPTRAWFTASPL